MAVKSQVREHMEVIGADGVPIGTVDKVEGDRIKLTRKDSGSHGSHHHYLSTGLIAGIEGDRVRLSANADAAVLLEEEKGGEAIMDDADVKVGPEKKLWNWNRIGIGAAAVGVAAAGAAAGAALLKRRNEGEDDFQLRLETDENVRLIASTKVEGTPVVGRDGETLGHIQSFLVDKYTGRVAYAVMKFGGTMGFGASFFPLPWPMLEYDVEKDGYALELTKEQLANAPRFEANDEPEFDPEYRRRIILFYRAA